MTQIRLRVFFTYSVHNPPEGGALVAGVARVGGGPGGAAEGGGGGGELLPVTEHHVHLEGDNCKQGTWHMIYTQTGATLCAQSLGGIDRVVSVARDADGGSGDAQPAPAEPVNSSTVSLSL